MQAEVKGDFIYLYSGRNIENLSHPEVKDPFARVKAVRISAITGAEIDYQNEQVILYAQGFHCPIYCTFGDRNCHRINCFYDFVPIIQKALGLDYDLTTDLKRRNSETSNAITRADQKLLDDDGE